MLSIYKASAGSGKTYRLAYEYIRALLGTKNPESGSYRLNLPKYNNGRADLGNRHRYILAITFTNKATEEMKRRIIDRLNDLTIEPKSVDGKIKDVEYADDLCKEFGCKRDELAQVAELALRQLLTDYSSFNVTTIDSFFQRVLRTFARELDFQGDFSVELNDLLAVQHAVGAMLDEFNADSSCNPGLGQWIYDYMYQNLERGEKSNFFNRRSKLHSRLVSLVANICDETFKPYAEPMRGILADSSKMPALKKEIAKLKQSKIQRVNKHTSSLLRNMEEAGLPLDSLGSRSAIKRIIIQDILNDHLPAKKDLFGEAYTKGVETPSAVFLKKYQDHPATAMISEILSFARREYAECMILDDIYSAIDELILLGYAWGYLSDFIAQNNMVLLSDTNHLLSRIIGHDDTPFIYERMGVNFQQFLIDEFQDTSKMQWRNLKPLVENGLSTGSDSLIIGDEKQSIYRFRNSDSSLLHHQVAYVDFPLERGDVKIEGEDEKQNTNYRSAADIVRFNNTLFSALATQRGIEGFENVVQSIRAEHTDLKGHIRFIPVEDEKRQKDTEDTDKNPLELMAEIIKSQNAEGKYPWSHIAILVATNMQAAKVVDYLINVHPEIPVLSDEALYVRKSPAVQLVMGILKILAYEDPESQPAEREKRHFPTPGEIAMTMSRFTYLLSRGMTADQAIDHAINGDEDDLGLKNIIYAIKQRHPSTLVSLVETVICEVLPPQLRQSQMSYLNALQDYVLDYCSKYNQSVRALVNNWETAKYRLTISSATNVNAVKVMTIHKSKGLEFDCVHIPYGSWPIDGKPRQKWLPMPKIEGLKPELCPPAISLKFAEPYSVPGTYFKGLYDEDQHEREVDTMNMTYVAYTRAGRELIVYYNPGKNIGKLISDVFACGYEPKSGKDKCCDLKSCYNVSDSSLTIGEPTTCKEILENTDDDNIMTIDSYDVVYHSGASMLTQVEDTLGLDPDIAAVDGNDDTEKYDIDPEARKLGIVYHDILSLIDTFEDIEEAVTQMRLKFRLSNDETSSAETFITSMLDEDNPDIRRWFRDNKQVMKEQSIYLPPGDPHRLPEETDDLDAYRRPDRIVINNDGSVDIIDYKFTSRTSGKHRKQVTDYMELLQAIGYDRIRGYLWYPFLGQIITVNSNK